MSDLPSMRHHAANWRDGKRTLGRLRVFILAISAALRRRGKYRFIRELSAGAKVLDVGCGNNSPAVCKAIRPDVYYVGIDITDYNQTNSAHHFANEYILTDREHFARDIARLENRFD